MIYLDNAATTKPDAKVLEVMRRYEEELYEKTAAVYADRVREDIKQARKAMTKLKIRCRISSGSQVPAMVFSLPKGSGQLPDDYKSWSFRMISSICLGVTIKGFSGKCFMFPVTR